MRFDEPKFKNDFASTKKRLGEQFKEYRKVKGLSAEVLADLIGVHRSTVHNTESGKAISLDTLAAGLAECDLTLDDFLSGFRSTDYPAEQQEDHRMLDAILNGGFSSQVAAVRSQLHETYEAFVQLKQARDKHSRDDPRPTQREEVGQAKGVGHKSQDVKRKRA